MLNSSQQTLTFTSRDIAATVFLFFVSTPALLSAGIFSVFMMAYLLLWLMVNRLTVPKEIIKLSLPILLLIIIGLLQSSGKNTYDVLKDIWYVGKSLLALIIGYTLMLHMRDLRLLLRATVLSATITSIYHLIMLAANPDLFRQSLYEFRVDVGMLFYIVSLGITIVAVSRKYSLVLFKRHKWLVFIVLPLCIASMFLSFSRTMIFMLIIMLLIIYNVLKIKHLNKAFTLIVVIAAFSSLTLIPYDEEEETLAYRTFFAKMAYTFKEIMVREYTEEREITLHWRGYESYMALQEYRSGTWLEHLTGKGFGTLIDLGIYVYLGDDEYRKIPVLHNGYLYLLVKTGLLGVVIYIFYFYKIILYAKAEHEWSEGSIRIAKKLIIAVSLVILLSTIGIAGFFNKSALVPFIVFLGALIAYVKITTGKNVFGGASSNPALMRG